MRVHTAAHCVYVLPGTHLTKCLCGKALQLINSKEGQQEEDDRRGREDLDLSLPLENSNELREERARQVLHTRFVSLLISAKNNHRYKKPDFDAHK